MKITVELTFFEFFPADKVLQFQECLKEIETGAMRYGTIELSVAPNGDGMSKICRVKQVKQFER